MRVRIVDLDQYLVMVQGAFHRLHDWSNTSAVTRQRRHDRSTLANTKAGSLDVTGQEGWLAPAV